MQPIALAGECGYAASTGSVIVSGPACGPCVGIYNWCAYQIAAAHADKLLPSNVRQVQSASEFHAP